MNADAGDWLLDERVDGHMEGVEEWKVVVASCVWRPATEGIERRLASTLLAVAPADGVNPDGLDSGPLRDACMSVLSFKRA